jgi:predicted acylesterase/phospholipase RssA
MALAASLAGCVTVARKEAPRMPSEQVAPVGFTSSVRIVNDTRQSFEERLAQVLPRVAATADGGQINILALSGGGAGAAFGAGALVGWTRAGNRPQFQIVTGASAGALIAPLAFLGSDWDGELEEAFAGSRTGQLLKSRFLGAVFGSSVYRGEPLASLVDSYVTAALIKAVAREAARGRLLLVATTNLDTEQVNVWNMTNIATQGGEPARRLFRDVLIASASIPGAFPPVLIHVEGSGEVFDELHADGGTTTSFFIAPEVAEFLPGPITALSGANLYVIVNGQLGVAPTTTTIGTLNILRRGITAGLNSGVRANLQIASSFARRNALSIEVTDIPSAYRFRGPLDLQPTAMKSLFQYAARCAAARQIWTSPHALIEESQRFSSTESGGTIPCPAAPYPQEPIFETAAAARYDAVPKNNVARERQ